jgi:hypothetical protein
MVARGCLRVCLAPSVSKAYRSSLGCRFEGPQITSSWTVFTWRTRYFTDARSILAQAKRRRISGWSLIGRMKCPLMALRAAASRAKSDRAKGSAHSRARRRNRAGRIGTMFSEKGGCAASTCRKPRPVGTSKPFRRVLSQLSIRPRQNAAHAHGRSAGQSPISS